MDRCARSTPRVRRCCDPIAQCTLVGCSYACVCPAGYTDTVGDGSSCADIDECIAGTDNCAASATCANTACNAGYSRNGVTCTDVNECSAGTDNCAAGATCTNTAGSYTCGCQAAFSGDGVTCTEIDECTSGGAKLQRQRDLREHVRQLHLRLQQRLHRQRRHLHRRQRMHLRRLELRRECHLRQHARQLHLRLQQRLPRQGITCTLVVQSCDFTGTFAMLVEQDAHWDPVLVSGLTVIAGATARSPTGRCASKPRAA